MEELLKRYDNLMKNGIVYYDSENNCLMQYGKPYKGKSYLEVDIRTLIAIALAKKEYCNDNN